MTDLLVSMTEMLYVLALLDVVTLVVIAVVEIKLAVLMRRNRND